MELSFLGRGSAFNPKEGTTSAYFIEENHLFLIDCGGTTFEKLVMKKSLDKVDDINVMITHTHDDHVGSLGSLVLHAYFDLHKTVHLIMPDSTEYINNIKNLLRIFGCKEDIYQIINEEEYDHKFHTFQRIRYIETDHCDVLQCFGLMFDTDKGLVYYSGDTRDLDLLKRIINGKQSIDKLFIDTSSKDFIDNPHLYIGLLDETIPEKLKRQVYCMHVNDDKCIEQIEEKGFQIVKIK